jgi:CRP/FNR family transcriptional regulator, cAMP and macrophage regulator
MSPRLGEAPEPELQRHAWLARSLGPTDYLLPTLEDLAAIAAAGSYVSKYPGTHLFRESEPSNTAFIIKSGKVEIYRGDDRQIVTRVGPGSVIGDIAMFRGEPYLQSARAIDHVTALSLDRDRLVPVLLQRPVVALRWLVAGLTQLDATQRRVLGLMHRSVLDQVVGLLHEEADSHGVVHLSQAAIARLLGVSRQTVNEAIGELRTRRLVETGYRVIRLTDTWRAEIS